MVTGFRPRPEIPNVPTLVGSNVVFDAKNRFFPFITKSPTGQSGYDDEIPKIRSRLDGLNYAVIGARRLSLSMLVAILRALGRHTCMAEPVSYWIQKEILPRVLPIPDKHPPKSALRLVSQSIPSPATMQCSPST